jgi:hypothetical protein
MALVTANGFPVLEAHVTIPRSGRPHGELAVAVEVADQLQGPLALDFGGKLVLKGTVRRSGAYNESVTLEFVGGGAGLLKQLQPKAYQLVPLSIPLAEALAEVGEVLSPTSDPDVLAVALPKWARMRGSALDEVNSLLARAPAGTVGRVLPDGTLWVGRDSYPDAGITFDLLNDDHASGQAELGVEVPTLLPGTTLLGRQVEEVTHIVTATTVRTVATFAADLADPNAEPPTSSAANDLQLLIDGRLRPTRYHRAYPAKVVAQNADGTLELIPDSDLMPGLSGVPIRTFAPEVSVTVAPGSRCQVVFEEGDPQRPTAAGFESPAGALLKVAITAPDVRLGGDALAVDALVKGTTYRAADATFDAALFTSGTAAATAAGLSTAGITTLATTLGGLPPTTPLTAAQALTLLGFVSALNAALIALGTQVAAAAQAKEGGAPAGNPALYLSTVSKTV